MIVDEIEVEELTPDSFKGVFQEVSIEIQRQEFAPILSAVREWRVILKGPIRLNKNTKALFFATGFGESGTHISEAITFAKEKIKQ